MFAGHRSVLAIVALWALVGVPARQQALWLDEAGRLHSEAREAIALLQGAAGEGLDPRDYPVPAADSASFDSALTASMLRYLEDVRFGRANPRALGYSIPPREAVDFAGMLRDAVACHRVRALAVDLSPQMPMYAELRRELGRYRTLADDARLRSSDDLPAFLAAIGDLPAGAEHEPDSLVDALKRFQARHGLEPDGVLGPSTRKALAVPLTWRARQIELSLERLRWLPRFPPQRILAVNIPMFRAWGMGDSTAPVFNTAVIVGRALKTRTPVLVEQMEYVIFRPYWNVPPSILRHEILPVLRRSPDYLQRHAMEIVPGESDAAHVLPPTAENIGRLGQGTLRVRQRPGPQNSLGLVKFVFPNDANVYMHGTPAEELFARARRDFSHGCIRVADPVGLAEWVLPPASGWTRERIMAAMNGAEPMRVDLARPIPVILFYMTALPQNGVIHFADDIYGHDARLDRYLAVRVQRSGG
jgi:L,D-transpeptidase YcbB